MKNIVHIDLNAFFVQCEENINPSLKGKPVAVGGSMKRGVISTANYVARKFGVHSAQSIYEAKSLCKDLILVDGNYRLYSKMSHKFMSFLRRRFGEIEVASIDECYIDVTNFVSDDNAYDYLRDLQIDIYKELTLKCSIGYAHTKFLAKMASDLVKPLGLTIIIKDDYKKLIWPLPIKDMWGIGKKTYPKLIELNVLTIGDLANNSNPKVKSALGSAYDMFVAWANGKGNDVVVTSMFDPKSISVSRTLSENETDYDLLKDELIYLCQEVQNNMVRSHKITKTICVTYRTDEFITKSKRQSLSFHTCSLEVISETVISIFEKFYEGEPVRLLGVALENLVENDDNIEQLSLFKATNSTPKTNKSKNKVLLNTLNSGKNAGMFKTLGDIKKDKKNEN